MNGLQADRHGLNIAKQYGCEAIIGGQLDVKLIIGGVWPILEWQTAF